MSSRFKKIFFRILRYTNQNFYHFLQFTVRKPELITIRSFFEQRSNKFFLQTDSIYYFPTYKQDIQLRHFLSQMDHCLTNVSITRMRCSITIGLIPSSGLLIICRNRSQISRDFWGQNRGEIGRFRGNFVGIFRANLAGKQSVKKRQILGLFLGQISQEINRFCADQTTVLNVFLTEDIIKFCSFNNNTLQK